MSDQTTPIDGEDQQARSAARLEARGLDLWTTATAPRRLLELGGRLTVETPLGPKTIWVTGWQETDPAVRIRGEGLPGEGQAEPGDLVILLEPGEAADEPSATRRRLDAFTRDWAA
jgi:curved DNA-binding protein